MKKNSKITPIRIMIGIMLVSFFLTQVSAVIYAYQTPVVIAVSQHKGKIDQVVYDCVVPEIVIHEDHVVYLLMEEETVTGMRYTVIAQTVTVLASQDGYAAIDVEPLYRKYRIVSAGEKDLTSGMEVLLIS